MNSMHRFIIRAIPLALFINPVYYPSQQRVLRLHAMISYKLLTG